jgi:DNA-binding response OmpR family regulator
MSASATFILWVGSQAPPLRTGAALRDHGYTLLHSEPGARAATLCRRLLVGAVVLAPGAADRACEIDAVRALRSAASDGAPLLVMVPRLGPLQEVLLLEAGADAVVDVEVEALVLLARLRTLLRRSHRRWPDAAALDLRTSPSGLAGGGVRVDGRKLALGASAQALVHELAVHAGQPASRAELARHLGPGAAGHSSRTVDMAISRLRRRLSAQGVRDIAIEAVRGHGYRLVLRGSAP